MAAQPNMAGGMRLLYLGGGAGVASWGIWGGPQGWAQIFWLAIGGAAMVLGIIGYSPLHVWFAPKAQKAV